MYEIVIGDGNNVRVSLAVFRNRVVLVIGFIISGKRFFLNFASSCILVYTTLLIKIMTTEELGPNLQFG
jgi:hypothetical protein